MGSVLQALHLQNLWPQSSTNLFASFIDGELRARVEDRGTVEHGIQVVLNRNTNSVYRSSSSVCDCQHSRNFEKRIPITYTRVCKTFAVLHHPTNTTHYRITLMSHGTLGTPCPLATGTGIKLSLYTLHIISHTERAYDNHRSYPCLVDVLWPS